MMKKMWKLQRIWCSKTLHRITGYGMLHGGMIPYILVNIQKRDWKHWQHIFLRLHQRIWSWFISRWILSGWIFIMDRWFQQMTRLHGNWKSAISVFHRRVWNGRLHRRYYIGHRSFCVNVIRNLSILRKTVWHLRIWLQQTEKYMMKTELPFWISTFIITGRQAMKIYR